MDFQLPDSKSVKAAQLADLIRDLAALFVQKEVKHPFITITATTIAPDFKRATIWFRSFPVEESATALERLERLEKPFQRYLLSKLTRRVIPHISFAIDTTVEEEAAISTLLNQDDI